MATKKKSNNFLFHNYTHPIQTNDRKLICRDCGYWQSDADRVHGCCSRTQQKTSLATKCYQTLEEMYGRELYIYRG